MCVYSSEKQVLQIGDSMNPIKHLKAPQLSQIHYLCYFIWSYSEGCSFYRASAVTRSKRSRMQCPWNREHPLLVFMCFSASEYHFFFVRLSCQDWFCMYQLLVTPDWIIAVDYDFLRIFFNCKSLDKPACVDSCVTAAIFGKFFILLGGLFWR